MVARVFSQFRIVLNMTILLLSLAVYNVILAILPRTILHASLEFTQFLFNIVRQQTITLTLVNNAHLVTL